MFTRPFPHDVEISNKEFQAAKNTFVSTSFTEVISSKPEHNPLKNL
jgi:hypothetical protein